MALKQAQEPAFIEYQQQVINNAQAFHAALARLGYQAVTGGTDLPLLLLDLRNKGIDGSRCERVLELAHIALNKNTVPGDKSALLPSGLRIGTPALTSRGFMEEDFETVARLLDRGVQIAKRLKAEPTAPKKLNAFREWVDPNDPEIVALREEVEAFASEFPAIGFDVEAMRYR